MNIQAKRESQSNLETQAQLAKTEAELEKATRELGQWKAKFERMKNHSNPYLFEDSVKFDLLESKQYNSDSGGKKGDFGG